MLLYFSGLHDCCYEVGYICCELVSFSLPCHRYCYYVYSQENNMIAFSVSLVVV